MQTSFSIHVAKLNETVELANLPESSINYGLNYGFTQSINDAAAAVVRKNFPDGADGEAKFRAEVRKRVMARVEQCRTGNVPNLRGPAPITTASALAHMAKETGLTVEQVAALLKNVPAPKK